MKNVLKRNCALLLLFLSSAVAVPAAAPDTLTMPHPPTLGASSSSNPNVPAYNAAVTHFNRATQEYAAAQAGGDPAAWQPALAAVSQTVDEIGNVIVKLGAQGGTSKDDNTMNDSLRAMRDYLFQLEHDPAWDRVVSGVNDATGAHEATGFHDVVAKYQAARNAQGQAGYQAAKDAADRAGAENAAAIQALLTKPRYHNNATLHGMLGYLDTLRGQQDQAVADLEKASQLDPNDPSVHYNLGTAYEQVKSPRYADAARQFQIVLDALGKGTPVASTVPGPNLTVNGVTVDLATALAHADTATPAGQADVARAVSLFQGIDGPNGDDPTKSFNAASLQNYGYALDKIGKITEAASVLDRAAALDPKNGSSLLSAGVLHADAGENDKAITDLAAAVGPDVEPTLDATGKYNAHFALGTAYVKRDGTGDRDLAIAQFKAASAIQQDNPSLQLNAVKPLYNEGVTQELAGLDTEAVASLRAANAAADKLDPKDPKTQAQIQVALGRLLAKSSSSADLSEAASLLSQAAPDLPQDGSSASVYSTLGGVYARLNEPDKANVARVQALALNSHDAGSRLALADSYAALKQPSSDAQAIEMYQQALADLAAQNPPAGAAVQANVQNQIGVLYQRLGQSRKAQAAFRQALSLNPDLAAAQNNLGVTYELLDHDPARARAAYQAALRLNGGRPLTEASYNLNRPAGGTEEEDSAFHLNESGTAYFELKRYAKALAAFKRASEIASLTPHERALILNNVGATYTALAQQKEARDPQGAREDRKAARDAYHQALALDPSVTVSQQNLSDFRGRPRLVPYGHDSRP